MARTRRPRRRKADGDAGGARFSGPADLFSAAQAVTEETRRLRAQATALAETQRALHEANRRFADLYDFVPIPYLIVSNMGVITHANEAALQMFGGAREWVAGRPLIGYVDTPDMRKVLDTVLAGRVGVAVSHEVRMRGRDGIRIVQMIARRRYHEVGDQATHHIALIDLTEVHRLEDDRRRADAERLKSQEGERVARAASLAKDQFLAMLSHELRTPLTPILAAAEALVAHAGLSTDLVAKLEIIRRNVKAEARLIDDLLDVARITRNKLEVSCRPTDLHRLLTETLDAWRNPLDQHRIELHVAFEAPSHWVNGDVGRLGQVFRNVIANAVKFMEPRGRITVRTEGEGDRIVVSVADTGMGMTRAQLEHLFTPFAGRRDEAPRHGLGLGLVISHAIVEAHQGTLQVSSAGIGGGTTVRVSLPVIAEPAADVQPPAVETPAVSPPATVLLVEDDRDSAEMLAMLLSMEGFAVHPAGTVREALALAGSCDVLVSDIALPDGSGLDLIRTIHVRRPMRGIALSGYGSRKDMEKSLEAGFEEHLTKPVDLERLIAAVRRLAAEKA